MREPVTNTAQRPVFDRQGHRGCRTLMPENTIPAMIRALELGVTTLELDMVVTADNVLLVSHEPYFSYEISTDPEGRPVAAAEEKGLNIYRMPFSETQGYDVGLRPHPRFPEQEKMQATKPSLEALFDAVESYCTGQRLPLPYYNIEPKSEPATDGIYHPEPAAFAELLVETIRSKGLEDRVNIQSFDKRVLQWLHGHHPHLSTGYLIEEDVETSLAEQLQDLGFTPSVYGPAYTLVTPELVRSCHGLGMRIIPWTVNDQPTMKALIDWGVDGIITDDPRLFGTLT